MFLFKIFSLDVRIGNLRAIILKAKIRKPLLIKYASDVLSSRTVLNDRKTIYVFERELKNTLFHEVYNMKTFP